MNTRSIITSTSIFVFILTFLINTVVSAESINDSIKYIQKQWAITNYEINDSKKPEAFNKLISYTRKIVAKYPDKAEPKIWLAITLSSDAGINGGFSALKKVKEARDLLLEAEKIDSNAMNGSIYTSLGSLYYKVPGWPIGFGNNKKAKYYLEKAIAINPNGIDSNYFYGDFLFEQGKYKKALLFLKRASIAPARIGREIADHGRQEQIKKKLDLLKKKL